MKWTNVFKLPEPFAHLVSEDLYYEERERQLVTYCSKNGLDRSQVIHFSASDLIKPPRMRVLIRRHFKEIVSDVSMHVYRVLGTAIHTALRLASQRMERRGVTGYIPEERLFTHFNVKGGVVVISGEPDLVTPDGWLHDYKVVAVGALEKGVKVEWEQATNIYVWLRALRNLPTEGIQITFILRDWQQSKVVQEGYPKAGAQTMECPTWTLDQQSAFVFERVKLHLEADGMHDDELIECTGYGTEMNEMWEKPEGWAVIRENGARAAKVFRRQDFPEGTTAETVKAAADADMEIRNGAKSKKDKPYVVEHRPGERTRCQSFCDAKGFCSQYKEFAAAAFGKVEKPAALSAMGEPQTKENHDVR